MAFVQPGSDSASTPAPPLQTSQFPWTDAEINDVRSFSSAWRADHHITQGDAGQLEIAYENLRMQGLSHDDARQGAINVLGWQDQTPAPSTPEPAPPTPSTPAYVPPTSTSGPPVNTVGDGFTIPPPASITSGTPTHVLSNGATVPAYVPETPVFTPPAYVPPPDFQYDPYTDATPFSYDNYTPTTAADLTADPSYSFRVGEGLQALTNSAAARGVANTGGTLKDFINYGQNAASQEFGAVDARRLQDYTTNRANAFQNYAMNEANRASTYTTNRAGAVSDYNTNYQTQYVDPYKIAYTGAVDAFTPQMTAYQTQAQAGQHESDQDRSYDYQTWLQEYNQWRANRNDTFDEKYRITALQ
jgi:hypothetical protein